MPILYKRTRTLCGPDNTSIIYGSGNVDDTCECTDVDLTSGGGASASGVTLCYTTYVNTVEGQTPADVSNVRFKRMALVQLGRGWHLLPGVANCIPLSNC